jgi:hypothetical protein
MAKRERQHYEWRIKEAMQRAAAPPYKKHGKPDMFRSVLPYRAMATPALEGLQHANDRELAHFLHRVF